MPLQPKEKDPRSEFESDLEEEITEDSEQIDFSQLADPSLRFQGVEQKNKKQIAPNIAARSMIIYLIISALICALFSDEVINMLPINQTTLISLMPYKTWFALLLAVPIIYLIIRQQTQALCKRNQQLEMREKKIINLSRVHRISREINHLILRLHNPEQLLQESCEILQQQGGFRFVWAGLSDTKTLLPEVLVSAGHKNNYLQDLFDGLHQSSAKERGEPALTALRKKYHVVINDIAAFSKKYFPWQSRAIENGFLSVSAFPFTTQSERSGVFALYAPETNAFSEEETELFRELVTDIGYGLSNLEQKEHLYYAANFDVITNLPNRKLFEDRLNQSIARGIHDERYIGVAILELPEFKKMVDLYGQAAGDKLLQETSQHLSQLIRDGDTIGRTDQNELGVLLTDVSEPKDVAMVIQQFLRPFMVKLPNATNINVCLRAGVALFPQDADNGMILIKNARQALQGTKQDSINCDFYSKEMASGVRNFQKIAEEMQDAFRREEFLLYYQPVVDIESKKIIGVEALTRWRNPKLGEVSPVQFIPVAEESKLIIPLGKWVIKTACLQLKNWKKIGIELAMSVNISSKQLTHPDFISEITTLFKELEFNPKEYSLGFEFTENTIVNHLQQATTTLGELRELGLKVYIDNFGTGTTSLSYLYRLPVDVLKIDSMFIRTLGKDQNVKTMIKGILALANGLELKTIAKGVETEKQIKALKVLGCKEAQGYFFSPPMIPKNLEGLLNSTF